MALLQGELRAGQHIKADGNITTLKAVGARPSSMLETGIGFGPGRLAAGYHILLVAQQLTPQDFEFAGTTGQSGGRSGLPKDTSAEDRRRPRISDGMKTEYGKQHYEHMKELILRNMPSVGMEHLARIEAVTLHNPDARPDLQYPPGDLWAKQWVLIKPCDFLVALDVDPGGKAHGIDGFIGNVGPSAKYDDRAAVHRYLERIAKGLDRQIAKSTASTAGI